MATFEDMSLWNSAEIESNTRALLPPGVSFQQGWDRLNSAWHVRFFTTDPETGQEKVMWEERGMDERITLFNAYGWAMSQFAPAGSSNSVWTRSHELARPTAPTAKSLGVDASMPEDLDPDEIAQVIASVYPRGRRAK